jgi:hypothetical protein
MRAAVCRAFGKPLVVEEVVLDPPGPGELKVAGAACAICHSDIIYAEGGSQADRLPVWHGDCSSSPVATGPGAAHDTLADVRPPSGTTTRGGPEMARSTVMATILAMTCLGLAGCGSEGTAAGAWSQEAAQYAVYATRIPLYPGTTIEDAMGSERWGANRESFLYGMTWWCTVQATRDELRTWYEGKLPTAARETNDDGQLVLTVVPEGAGPRETMGVLIEGDGKYRVFELTLQKKAGT